MTAVASSVEHSASGQRINFSGGTRLPVILQSEAAECGLACMAMVAEYHQHKIGLTKLRREYPVSLKGSTLKTLMEIAHQLRFTTRALRLELEEMKALRAPAILHWGLNHFVVLKQVRRDAVIIHDPAIGERTLSLSTVSKHFTGVALELLPTQDFERRDERERLSLWPLVRGAVGLRGFLLRLLLLSLALQLFSLLSPMYTQIVIDEAIARQDEALLNLLAMGFLMILIIRMSIGWMRSWMVIYGANLLSQQLQGNLQRHMLRLPMSFFYKRHVGDVVSRYGSMSAIQSLLTTGFVQAILDGVLLLSTLVVLLLYQPKLTAVVSGLLLGYALLRYLRFRPMREMSHENLIAGAEASSQFMQTIRGMATIKQFGLELDRLSQWQNRYVEVTNTNIRLARLNMGFGIINELMFGIGGIVILYMGAQLIFAGQFTIGMLMAFSAYMQQFLGAGSALINKWMSYKMLDLHLERLADIALAEPEEADALPQPPLTLEPSLRAIGVKFRYAAADPLVLDGVEISIAPGACVVIVGPSGSGKSTLMRVMQGLEKPIEGKIEFGGVELRNLGFANYRRYVASVTQDDKLLTGSILENITLFDEKPDHSRAVECARQCRIHESIMRMPMNYQSLIGDMGDALSAGERQRLMLARSLYRQPKLLFLDEATSNMDAALDAEVNEMLASLKITRIIVTHRTTPLAYADSVYQLVAGKLERLK